ncbi:MAG: hypothetical protein ABW002_04710 [Xanthomonas sp.]
MAEDEWDALELLARMLVGGGYRVPVAGRGTKGTLSSGDIAGALAMMGDPLEKATVLAVGTRADAAEVARLAFRSYRRVAGSVLMQRPRSLKLSDPADRWRLRLVIYDAASELVWPEKRRSYAERARAAKMRKAVYIQVHKCATSVMQSALAGGRKSFARAVFANG